MHAKNTFYSKYWYESVSFSRISVSVANPVVDAVPGVKSDT